MNAQNKQGNTALHLAIKVDSPFVRKLILASSGKESLTIKNKWGKTPVDYLHLNKEANQNLNEFVKARYEIEILEQICNDPEIKSKKTKV